MGRITSLLERLMGADDTAFSPDDHRLAAAVLLTRVLMIDGMQERAEKAQLLSILRAQYGLDEDEARALFDAALVAEREASGLGAFADLLVRRLDPAGRAQIIMLMTSLAHADGELHEFEDALIARAAAMLGVTVLPQ